MDLCGGEEKCFMWNCFCNDKLCNCLRKSLETFLCEVVEIDLLLWNVLVGIAKFLWCRNGHELYEKSFLIELRKSESVRFDG